MNDEYMYKNGEIIVRSEGKIKKSIPYQDNFEQILICENTIFYLKSKAINDTLKLNSLISSRSKNVKIFSILAPLTTGATVGFAVSIANLLTALVGTITIPTIVGDVTIVNAYLAASIPMVSLMSIGTTAQIITKGPSKKDILGYREMIRYEHESIEEYEHELELLKAENYRKNEYYKHNDSIFQPVPDRKQIRIVRELRELRFAYGQAKEYYLHKNPDKLAHQLQKAGYLPETIAEFIMFIESKQNKLSEENIKSKHNKNL